MAQSIQEIQEQTKEIIANSAELPVVEILTENEQNTLGAVNSTSKAGVVRMLVYVFAVAANAVQKLWDIFRAEVEALIAASRPFTERWYRKVSLAYQHGYELDEKGNYPVPVTPAEIDAANASKVVKKAAVMQTVIANVGALRMKVAGQVGEELQPLTPEQLAGYQEYIERKGAAGIFTKATTADADLLKVHYKVYFDALVLDNQGRRLDGTANTPVQDAIKAYLKSANLNAFNGVLSLARLTDVVQGVEGVEDPFLVLAASKYAAYNYEDSNANGTVGAIVDFRRPDSGYMKLDEVESIFEFIPIPV